MAGTLSPVMLMAAQGLLDNTALRVAPDLTANIAVYDDLPVVSSLSAIIDTARGNVGNTTLANLQQLGSTTLPALTNAVASDYHEFVYIGTDPVLPATTAGGFSGLVLDRADTIMGNGDLGRFSQIYQTSLTYKTQSNQYIATGLNASAINATFISMDSLSTGGVSDVSTDLPAFGADLARLGQAINLAELNLLGFPSVLLRQTIQQGNGGILPALRFQLELQGITSQDLLTLTTAATPEIVGSQELAIYRAMQNIQGTDLDQILEILDVTTPGLSNMADLLDPVKIFPNSYLSLTVTPPQIADTSVSTPSIYVQAATVNNQLGQVFGVDGPCELRNKIMPADQALATQAIGRSLQTLQNVAELTLPELAQAVSSVETLRGLDLIESATTAVSDALIASITAEVAPTLTSGNITIPVSTGAGNTFVMYDFIGTAAGYPHAQDLESVSANIQAMSAAGQLNSLLGNTGAYAAMTSVLSGNLTVAPPWGSGTYGNIDLALDAVIANTNTEIANIADASVYTANLTAAWADMSAQLIREEYNQYLAHVELDELTANSLPTVMSLAGQLHDTGLDITPRDSADFFEATANIENQGGQAVIASLREGRNIAALQAQGIGINTNLSDTLPPG